MISKWEVLLILGAAWSLLLPFSTAIPHSSELAQCDDSLSANDSSCSIAPRTIIPLIDISPLLVDATFTGPEARAVVDAIGYASRTSGFFYVTNHGVPEAAVAQLKTLATHFFSQDQEYKDAIAMVHGGKAWRGYFKTGDELTSGIPDQKEGIYFGTELTNDDPRPMHGPNIFPQDELGEQLRNSVLAHLNSMRSLGGTIVRAIACSLGIDSPEFRENFAEPTELFRIFNYPPHDPARFPEQSMGVGEHTDYGYVTILWQDEDAGGLQVRSLDEKSWISAPPIPGTFVINLGDALEHATGGLLRATPHRVLQRKDALQNRLSFPYFFDPAFEKQMISMVPLLLASDNQAYKEFIADRDKRDNAVKSRWDKMDPTLFEGTYGQYLLKKVSKAFPQLAATQLQS